MRQLRLAEYKTCSGVSLAVHERDTLREAGVTVQPTPEREGLYDLTPSSWVGAIDMGSLAVEIRPKLPIDRVLFLISYALDRVRWRENGFGFAEEPSLLEAIVPGFVAQVGRALRRGVLQGYRTEEAALATVRGRLRFDDQIRYRFGRLPPVEVRYDELTQDVEENRLIKAALARLGRMRIRSDPARVSLRRFDAALEMVRLVPYDARRLPDILYTRLNEHYRPAVELAKLILRATSFELRHGDVRSSAFLVDMNMVFEDFVVVALREALKLSARSFPQNAAGKPLRLDGVGRIRLEPDISWWDGETCTFVGDVKYKRVEAEGIKHPDLYQLLAYTIAADVPGGLLVYAAGEAEAVAHRIVHLGKELQVTTLDLQGPPAEILKQIGGVAQRVRVLRRWAQRGMSEPAAPALVPTGLAM